VSKHCLISLLLREQALPHLPLQAGGNVGWQIMSKVSKCMKDLSELKQQPLQIKENTTVRYLCHARRRDRSCTILQAICVSHPIKAP